MTKTPGENTKETAQAQGTKVTANPGRLTQAEGKEGGGRKEKEEKEEEKEALRKKQNLNQGVRKKTSG